MTYTNEIVQLLRSNGNCTDIAYKLQSQYGGLVRDWEDNVRFVQNQD